MTTRRASVGRSVLAGALCLGLLTACGSTVAPHGQPLGDGLSATGGGVAAPVVGGDADAPGASAAGALTGSGPATAQDRADLSSGTAAGTGSVPVPAAGAGSLGQASAPGSRATGPVQIGIVVSGDVSAVASGIGAGANSNGPEQTWASSLVQALNQRGGLAGRTIQPIFYSIDVSRSGNTSTEQYASEACATFTQDNRVEAVVTGWHAAFNPALSNCLKNKGVVVESASDLAKGLSVLRGTGNLFAVNTPPLESAARAFAQQLNTVRYSGGKKVGVITYDAPDIHDAVRKVLLPRMRAGGTPVDDRDVFYLTPAQTTSDVSRITQEQSGAILKLRQDGIEHVVFFVGAALLFIKQAENQNYKPRYAFASLDDPQALVNNGVGADTLENAVGIGWQPVGDVQQRAAGDHPAGEASCRRIIEPAAKPASSSEFYVAASFCDGLFFLEQLARVTSGRFDPQVVAADVGSLPPFTSAMTFGSQVTAARPAGATRYRPLAYDTGCSCFTYSGAARALP